MGKAIVFLGVGVLLLTPASAAAADGFMSAQDFQFAPASVEVLPGEKVDFNFEGPSFHTATLRSGQVDSYNSRVTGPGFTKSHRFRHRGRFGLLCLVHPSMRATVQVGAPETGKPRIGSLGARTGRGAVRLTFRLSERSLVTVAIGSRRVRRVLAGGRRSILVRGLRRGRHTARLAARDGWSNRSAVVRRGFSLR